MIVGGKNLPAEVGKSQPKPRSAAAVIGEMARVQNELAERNQLAEMEGMSVEEMFERGREHEDNEEYEEAMKWFRRAAEQGHIDAQRYLGYMYSKGEGVPQDYVEGVKWYRRAVEQGDANAQSLLGGMYHEGEGVPQDYAEAAKLYRRAAEQGDAQAQHNLGLMHRRGEGVPQDYAEAAKWFRLAAEQGYYYVRKALFGWRQDKFQDYE